MASPTFEAQKPPKAKAQTLRGILPAIADFASAADEKPQPAFGRQKHEKAANTDHDECASKSGEGDS
jgi:hypothetical protein